MDIKKKGLYGTDILKKGREWKWYIDDKNIKSNLTDKGVGDEDELLVSFTMYLFVSLILNMKAMQ